MKNKAQIDFLIMACRQSGRDKQTLKSQSHYGFRQFGNTAEIKTASSPQCPGITALRHSGSPAGINRPQNHKVIMAFRQFGNTAEIKTASSPQCPGITALRHSGSPAGINRPQNHKVIMAFRQFGNTAEKKKHQVH